MAKKLLMLIAVVLLANLVAAIVVTVVSWGPRTVDYKGSLALTQEEFTQFKTDLYNCRIKIRLDKEDCPDRLVIINSNEPILVQFTLHDKPLSPEFPWGHRSVNTGLSTWILVWIIPTYATTVLLSIYKSVLLLIDL